MDGGGDQFITDLDLFWARMNSYGVPAGISEDWDRRDWISGENGVGLTDLGAEVKANSEYCHAHVMPLLPRRHAGKRDLELYPRTDCVAQRDGESVDYDNRNSVGVGA